MKIEKVALYSYQIPLQDSRERKGILVCFKNQENSEGWGEIAPLPNLSRETFEQCLAQIQQTREDILTFDWTLETYSQKLDHLKLLPAVSFGVESALLSLLSPLDNVVLPTSALLMGSIQEILEQAEFRYSEGYTSAKLKVSQLNFQEAAYLIHQLKDQFHLRIDVNRAWSTLDSLKFFSQFPLDTFDYVEEPFANPQDLHLFTHSLAVDESFPKDLSLEQLENLPMLKVLIYKPTIQGGLRGCLDLHAWAKKRGIALVMSSSFESDIGLAHVAAISHRLSLSAPVGIGTYHFLQNTFCKNLKFSHNLQLTTNLILKLKNLENIRLL